MATVFLKKYWTKYFSHSLQLNQPGREQDWGYHWLYDIIKAHGGDIKVETKEGEEVSLSFNCRYDPIDQNKIDLHFPAFTWMQFWFCSKEAGD